MVGAHLFDHLRKEAREAPESGIVAVMNHGRLKEGIIPLWAGEGDLPSPDFIRQAGIAALENGETFYTWQRGIPELREALARYHTRHFGRAFSHEQFLVTGSGMQSIQLAIQAIAGNSDEIMYLAPSWPNFAAAAAIAGARPIAINLDFGGNGWSFDPSKLEAHRTPATKAIFVNSPSNPTGWTADIETLSEILAFARKHGLWIVADEIYSLFHYNGARAASFMDIMDPDDRIIFVNSFSKNWAMTGWRMGWLTIPPILAPVFENLIQYSTSGVAQFMQRAGVVALDNGDEFISMQVERAKTARDILCSALLDTGRVRLSPPDGAFYLFFAVDGIKDSKKAAFAIVDEANVGLAPGSAFGTVSQGFFRICFNRKLDDVSLAANRLSNWIISQ
jgi:aspartate/methionine/tyrosine aminotransferase